MLDYVKRGFKTMTAQQFALVVLWLYQFAWGFALFAAVKSVVEPLMRQFPGTHLPAGAAQLFIAESQFQLFKTDISHPYLLLLAGFALLRMAITPLLNAALYYSIHHTSKNAGYRFFQGIRELARPFALYYALRMILTIAPLYWLYPIAVKAFSTHGDYGTLGISLLPWVAGYGIYVLLLHLCFMYVQWGKATDRSLGASLLLFVRKLHLIVAIALTLAVMSGAVTAIALAASLVWAGLIALIVQQSFHLIQLMFKLWALSAHYHVHKQETAH